VIDRDSNHLALGVVILAAGFSSRMGRPKLLLPWGNATVLEHLLRQWTNLNARQIAIVTRMDDAPLEELLDLVEFPSHCRIRNPDPSRGMFSSIRCAAAWDGWETTLTHWAISLGDQPHVKAESLRALMQFAATRPDSICQPLRNGHGRHPVILPAPAFADLAATMASTLKEFLQSRPGELACYESFDPGLDLDLDTPQAYERALREFGPGDSL
jgi:molybdenum cofactor cytidylyltransferase